MESKLDPANAIYDFTVLLGDGWDAPSLLGLRLLRIVDVEGNQAVDTSSANAHDFTTATPRIPSASRGTTATTGTGSFRAKETSLQHYRRHVRTARHDRRSLRRESNQVRYAIEKPTHSCRDTFLLTLSRLGKRNVEVRHHP